MVRRAQHVPGFPSGRNIHYIIPAGPVKILGSLDAWIYVSFLEEGFEGIVGCIVDPQSSGFGG